MGSNYAEAAGWEAALDDPSPRYFQCIVCNATELSADIEYTALGYPRCPECAFEHGP